MNTVPIVIDENGVAVCRQKLGHGYRFVYANKELGGLYFQDGPIREVGVNGTTNELVLSVLIDRTQYLDDLYPCQENKQAITHLQAALDLFNARTKDRIKRGVEGTNAL